MIAAASAAVAVILFDLTAVAVLLPTIRVDLGASSSGGQWVLNAHLLALAALFVVLTSIPLPRRALAGSGALAMAAGGALCATAGSTSVLVAGRAVQGAGAAALLAAAVGAAQPGRRGLALAAPLPALALVLGPLVGGVFGDQNWWGLFFWACVPLTTVAAAPALLSALPAPEPARFQPRRLALAAGLTAITIALVQSEPWSWAAAALLLLAGSVLTAVARVGEPRSDAASWAVAAGCLAALAFLMPGYFELARGLSPLRGGALMLALTVPAIMGWALARRLADRVPALAGVACAGAGLLALVTIDASTSYAFVVAGLAVVGAGLGVTVATAPGPGRAAPPVLAAALAGATLGLAAAGAAFQHVQADERADGAPFDSALAAGVAWASLVLLLGLVALGALRLRQRPY